MAVKDEHNNRGEGRLIQLPHPRYRRLHGRSLLLEIASDLLRLHSLSGGVLTIEEAEELALLSYRFAELISSRLPPK